jgi:hypothetical protein
LFSLAAKKYHELERGEGSDRRDSEIAVAAEGRARGERICRAAKSPGKLPTKEETVGDNVIEEVKPVGNTRSSTNRRRKEGRQPQSFSSETAISPSVERHDSRKSDKTQQCIR